MLKEGPGFGEDGYPLTSPPSELRMAKGGVMTITSASFWLASLYAAESAKVCYPRVPICM